MFKALLIVVGLALAAVPPVSAQVITFETDPSGALSADDAPLGLASAYAVGGLNITFGFDGDLDGVPETTAYLERIGADGVDAFQACNGRDAAATGLESQLGDFFLRGNPGADFGKLIIKYSGGTVSSASGEIWDIDGLGTTTEQYRVQAFDALGSLLATIDSPVGNQDSGCANTQLDGRPWTFAFSGLSPGIASITIDFIGTKTNSIGLAFNNFNATGEETVSATSASWGRLKTTYR